ncbi:methyltransferase domain-containing protein [Pseudoalteromonas pernae]|uniref:methyltransferase domain-containing protein n=1 Tax=Pseudoalteromonas pernae TaxID=3118054 RepID=UPI003242D97A
MSAALKLRTQNQFSKAASQYQANARVQASSSSMLLERIGQRDLGVCLDLGAGPGVNSFALQAKSQRYIALDLSAQMLAQITQRSERVCADMDALPFKDNVLDTVFSNFAMQWSQDMNSALAQLHRVLKPGGRAFLAVVAEHSLHEVKQAFASVGRTAINNFNSLEQLQQMATSSGFTLAWVEQKVLFDYFNSASEALRSLSAIGATSSEKKQKPITKLEYAGVLKALQQQGVEVKLSYNVAFLELVK